MTGAVRGVRVATQYQEELPVQRPLVRAFHVAHRAVHAVSAPRAGRHPLQTSDALGAAAVQLGPQAIAFAVLLNKRFGLPYGKIAALLRDRFGLTVTRGGLVHAVHRAARQAQPTYDALCATVRGSPVVTADETSWRVDADLQWLWAFVTPRDDRLCDSAGARARASGARHRPRLSPACCSATAGSRIGNFTQAAHQTCLAHLLRRCRVLLLDYPRQPFVTAVKAILQAALATRDGYHAGDLSAHGLAVARGHYVERLGPAPRSARRVAGSQSRRFQQHLIIEFDAIFSFLFDPTLDATNWRAEHALRPAVVTRKMCGGGNRTAAAPTVSKSSPASCAPPPNAASMPTALLVALLTAPTPIGAAEPPDASRVH